MYLLIKVTQTFSELFRGWVVEIFRIQFTDLAYVIYLKTGIPLDEDGTISSIGEGAFTNITAATSSAAVTAAQTKNKTTAQSQAAPTSANKRKSGKKSRADQKRCVSYYLNFHRLTIVWNSKSKVIFEKNGARPDPELWPWI